MTNTSFSPDLRAAVFGASGGIGAALVRRLLDDRRTSHVYAGSRTPPSFSHDKLTAVSADITDEASLEAAAKTIGAPLDLVIIASGILHGDDLKPEKALRDLDADTFGRVLRVNTIGPALAVKHFAPLLRKDRKSVMAAISARVGSIGDNRLGGWYAYRASKAALNMVLKTASIEVARRNKHAAIIGLHPGTVDTALSKPFQRGVPDGKLFSPDQSAGYLLDVIGSIDASDSGHVFAWDGARVPD